MCNSTNSSSPAARPGPGPAFSTAVPLWCDRVSYRVGASLLVDGISVDLAPGRLLGLVGPNGAGKSTLLRLLGGLLPAAAGTVYLNGADVAGAPADRVARQVARVPQSVPGEVDFPVLDMVLMGRYARSTGWQETANDRQVAGECLARSGAAHLTDRTYSSLSGGERQRVIIARALAQEPRVLLLDEPTANLDLRHQIETFSLMRRLTAEQGMAVFAAIHDLSLAARYCDELVLLDYGRVVATGPPAAVLRPDLLRQVFQVEAVVDRHPRLGHLMVTVLGTAGSVIAAPGGPGPGNVTADSRVS